MKKISSLMVAILLFLSVSMEASASVNTISMTASRSNSTINTYVKNNDNKKRHNVCLKIQKKNGRNYSTKYHECFNINPDKQIKKSYRITKGSYKIVYSSGGKSSYKTINW